MPYARQTVTPLLQPPLHNVALGILGDAGIVGLLAALILLPSSCGLRGRKPGRPLPGRAAYAAIVGIAIAFMTEDLTFAELQPAAAPAGGEIALLDARVVSWRPIEHRLHHGSRGSRRCLLVCVLLGDAAAVSYGAGIDAAAVKDWATAQDRLAFAVTLDPLQPTGPKALAVAADWNGSNDLARRNAERAVELNPGDGSSWTNLSLLCLAERDRQCALNALDHAVRTSGESASAQINAAVVYAALDQPTNADAAYRSAMLTTWQTALPWPGRGACPWARSRHTNRD